MPTFLVPRLSTTLSAPSVAQRTARGTVLCGRMAVPQQVKKLVQANRDDDPGRINNNAGDRTGSVLLRGKTGAWSHVTQPDVGRCVAVAVVVLVLLHMGILSLYTPP